MKREIHNAFGKVFTVAAAVVFAASADTLYWTGAASLWGDAGAWTNSAGEAKALASGDSVVIDIGETGVTMNNDIQNLSLAKFTALGKNNVVLRIDGEPIGLAGTTSVNTTIWTNHCSIVLNAGVSLSGGKGRMFFGGYSTVVNGDIAVASGCELKMCGRPYRASVGPSFSQEELIGDEPIIRFYGDVGGDGSSLYINFGANGNGTTAYFYGNVNCANLYHAGNTCPNYAHLTKPGNRIGAIRFYATNALYFDADEALTEDTVINFDETSGIGYVWSTSAIRFKAGSHQTLNRLMGGDPSNNSYLKTQCIFAGNAGTYGNPSADFCTLELKGTADAVSYMLLCDAVNVVWNPTGDYTQDFRDSRHVTCGSLEVRRGTVRTSGTNTFVNLDTVTVAGGAALEIASTNAVAFPSLALASFGENARLRVVDADSVAFNARTTKLSLAAGAKIEVAAGGVVDVGRLHYNGNEVAAGSYTSAEWMDGGTVNVAGEIDSSTVTRHYWASAEDGAWNVAANWHAGVVPGAAHHAFMNVAGPDYTTTFDGASCTMPSLATVAGNGNTATLALTGEVKLKGHKLYIQDGGRLTVPSGATLVNTNTELKTTSKTQINIFSGGEVCVSGTGRIVSRGNDTAYTSPVRLQGGRLVFRDSAELSTGSNTGTTHYFTEGETIFADSSRLLFGAADYVYVYPTISGVEAKLKFIDHAGIDGVQRGDTLIIGNNNGGTYYGKASVEFLSDCNHPRHFYCAMVGMPYGEGTLLIGAGNVLFNGRGIGFGCSNGGRWAMSTKSGGIGHLVVTGGVLRVTSGAVGEGLLTGLRFGEGAIVNDSIAESYTPWYGNYLQSGGVVTNSGCFCVGGERGSADFLQTGGELYNTGANNPFFAGVRGGRGQVTFAGGEATIDGDVYAGGIFTNVIPHGVNTEYPLDKFGWKDFVHYGTGTITMSNGVVTLKKALNLGYDGTGIVERVGSQGSFTVQGGMMLSNTTAFASASILRFVLDADGIKPIQVGGTVTSTPGSRIEVDISAYAGRKGRHALLTAAAIEGDFEEPEITSAGGGHSASGAKVEVEPTGIYLTLPTGIAIIFR